MFKSRFHSALLVCMVAFAVLTPPLSAEDKKPETWKWNDPRELGIPGLRHATIESTAMKRTVGYQIYLPPQYEKEPGRRFPVVYFLHGAGGTESSDAGLAASVNAEVVAGMIDPVIYVFPNGGQTSGYRDWPEDRGNVKTETMLMRELIPHVDKTYRTIGTSGTRSICGFSMGGGGAMRLTLKYPGVFGAAASLAAALDESPEAHGGDNCYMHASALSKEARERLRLYLVVGEEDFLFPRHAPFLKHAKELGIPTTFVVHSKISHDLGALTRFSGNAMIRQLSGQMHEAVFKLP